MDIIKGIERTVNYIENNITGNLTIEDIASKAYMSNFQFQKVFTIICGIPLGEYIRSRRLVLAAEEIISTNEKIIDIAFKYGYETHEGFSRAFTRFHKTTPTAARSCGNYKTFAPITVESILEGMNVMQDKITQRGYTVGDVDVVYLTPDMDKTAKWFEDVLGWYAGVEVRDENGKATYGCAMPFDGKLVHLGITSFNGFFLLPGDTPKSLISMMSVKGVESLYEHVIKSGWKNITKIETASWGAKVCDITTIDGCTLRFFESI